MHRNLRHLAAALALSLPLAAQMPSPALLVLNKDANELAIVDPSDGKVVARVPTGESPHEVAVSEDGKVAFVTNFGKGTQGRTLSVIDLPGRKEIHRVDITPLGGPHGITVSGGKAYFTAERSKTVGRYDPATNRVDWSLGTGQDSTHMILLSRDGNQIYTTNKGSNTISVLERYTVTDRFTGATREDWRSTVIPVGKGGEGFDLSPDQKQLAVGDANDGVVWFVDLATKSVTGNVDTGLKSINRIKFSPDGGTLLASDIAGGDLAVIAASTRTLVKRIPLGRQAEGILITPDGSRAYVGMGEGNYLAVVDLKTLTPAGRLETGKGPDGMAWVSGPSTSAGR